MLLLCGSTPECPLCIKGGCSCESIVMSAAAFKSPCIEQRRESIHAMAELC
jgi:hypothetical protein